MKHFLCTLWLLLILAAGPTGAEEAGLRAGAAAVDLSPRSLPAIRNGGFLQAVADRVDDPLFARCLVISGGGETIAIVVVDSCMLPTDVCDAIKARAVERTGIPADRILISATHTHSAPSVMAYCLGSGRDEAYTQFVIPRVADAIELAQQKLQPARLGWNSINAGEYTHCRRWITRADRRGTDPFGQSTVRAMMHPGYLNPNYVCPAGPVDPQLFVLSAVAAHDGAPICVLANFSMHYFGAGAGFSADYFGEVARSLETSIALASGRPGQELVGIMSQGTSGDLHWMDYGMSKRDITRQQYAAGVAEKVLAAWRGIEHRSDVTLSMAEARIQLRRRTPDPARLEWAASLNQQRGDQPPRNQPEVYAQQASWIHEHPQTEVVLQALRIGDLAITALPNEVFGITGLKLKAQSPLEDTFNLELANGAEGYIPPPEQHRLGGYTTWPARTAGLEVEAEPKIVEAVLSLLERVSNKPRRPQLDPPTEAARAVIEAGPLAYWRLGDIRADRAADAIGAHDAEYQGAVALYLPGPGPDDTAVQSPPNRCVYFAGGSLRAKVPELPRDYGISLWFWNGMPAAETGDLGTLLSRGTGADRQSLDIAVARSGVATLRLRSGSNQQVGTTPLATKAWHHVVLSLAGQRARVYLDGQRAPEIELEIPSETVTPSTELTFGEFDGKLDEIAVFAGELTAERASEFSRPATSGWADRGSAPIVRDTESSDSAPASPATPRSTAPAASLALIHVRDGYEVQLVASEPQIADPVAIDWGPDGRLWVVEMADYPLGIDGNGKPGGRVRVLRDADGDGRYESSLLFAEDLPFPTGILVWGQGVLVTAAPEIVYLEDSDGDGKADVRQALYRGFLEGNQQLRVNGLRWGLDNWVHCASGSHHSGYGKDNRITSLITGMSHEIGSRDFRIRPDSGEIDPLSGPSQFGRNRDDWGNWFGVQNSRPLWHYVLEDRDIRRNPHHAPPDPVRQVVTPINPPVYPAAALEKRFHSFDQSGRFTSACSAMVYRDDLLFERVDGQQHALTCEPFHNLVQHNIITDDGVSFAFRRDPAEAEFDFFASRDRWCRPVMVRTGPDGAVWVVDMYRYMIEHPEWLPQDGKDELRPYYRLGDEQGRIYRIVRQHRPPRPVPRLDGLAPQELVAQLRSSNGWQRDMAQRMLVQHQDLSVVEPLREMVTSDVSPLARLHALCVLDGLDALSSELLRGRLSDPHPAVRRHALRLAADRPLDAADLVTLASDPDAKVRLQLAATLGSVDSSLAAETLASLAADPASDPFIVANVMSSLHERNIADVMDAFLDDHLLRQAEITDRSRDVLLQLLSQVAALGDGAAIGRCVERTCGTIAGGYRPWQLEGLTQLLDGLERRKFSLEQLPEPPRRQIDQAVAAARAIIAEAAGSPTPELVPAMRLLLRQQPLNAAELSQFGELLGPRASIELQLAVIDGLAEHSDPQVADVLLAGWKSYGPSLRARVIDQLATRTSWNHKLLDHVRSGQITAAQIDPALRQRLASSKDESLRLGWQALLQSAMPSDRKQVVDQYQPALQRGGDAQRGAALFVKSCAACHRLGQQGHDVGPDLWSITDKRPESLLTAILDPSAAVEARYVSYVALTEDGRVHTGLLATETGSSITLLSPEGRKHTILRTEIEELQASGKSLMPDGMERELSLQDVADLIELLCTQRPVSSDDR
jgi:putative membrane-bound dehydrogenase-like protein